MTFKRKFLSVVASASIVASSFAGFSATEANAALDETKKFKPGISQEISTLALSQNETQELVIVTKGEKDISSDLKKLGVEVLENHKNYVYLANVPTSKVLDVYHLDTVASLGKNGEVTLEKVDDADLKGVNKPAEDVVVPATEETHDATGVDNFHDKYDGSGIRVAIIDSGPDPGHEAFTAELGEDGKYGDSKIVGVRDYTIGDQTYEYEMILAEGDVVFGDAIAEGDSIVVDGTTYNTTGIDSTDDEYHFGMLEPDANAGDLNADGAKDAKKGTTDEFGVLLVDDKVYIDTDNDQDFSDEIAFGNNEAGTFDIDTTDSKVGANFRVNSLDSESPFVNIFFDVNGHGTHVSGITAANGPAVDNGAGAVAMQGVAPGAELVGLKVFKASGGASTYSIMSAMIDAAVPESEGGFGADVANMSLGSRPDLNDGTDADDQLVNILSEKYGIVFVISAGNSGPGADTVGSPGVSSDAISVGAHINSKMWATEYGAYPYGKDINGNPLPGDGLWYFSSNGPREDGMQKPDIVAPGASFAAYPAHKGNYAVLQGTSMSAPYVAGVVAALKNAAEKDRVPFNYETVREALIQTANPMEGYTRTQQGAGLIDVPAAFDYLKSNFINDLKEVDVTVYHGEKVSGGEGLYVRNGETPEEVEVLVTNSSDEKKTLSLKASEDWFTPSKSSITLEPGKSEVVKVDYDTDALQVGRNEGTLVIDDSSTPYVEARSYQTIILGDQFTADNHFRQSYTGEVQSSKTKSYYFDVKPGADEIRFALNALKESGEYQGRVRMIVFNPDGFEVSEYQGYAGYGNGGLDVEENVFESPKPGVWEVAVYGTFGPIEGKEVHKYSLEAFVQGVAKTPGKITLNQPKAGAMATESVTFHNYLSDSRNVKVEGAAFSNPESTMTRETVPNKDYFIQSLTLKNNVSLTVKTSNPTNANDDVDLEFYKIVDGAPVMIGSSGSASSDEEVSFKSLEDGQYLVAVYGYSTVSGGPTEIDYTVTEARVLDPGEAGKGSVETSEEVVKLGVSEKLTTDVEITTPAEGGDYFSGVFLKDADTDEVLTLLPIEIVGDMINVIKGQDRILTSVETSKTMYPDGFAADHASKTVILATAWNFPDALSAGPLAAHYDAPILLVGSKGLTKGVKDEITRLGAENVIIVGGEAVVSGEVVTTLTDELNIDANNIERLAGEGDQKNRYGTNMAIVEKLQSEGFMSGNGVFLATGKNFADALSAGAVAGEYHMPIVLTNGETLTTEAEAVLTNEDVYVLGGTAAVKDSAYLAAEEVAGMIERLKGANRYGTLVSILEAFPVDSNKLFVASGANFPDALSATPLVTMNDSSLVLVKSNELPKEVKAFLTKYDTTNDIQTVHVLGGDSAVSETVKGALRTALQD